MMALHHLQDSMNDLAFKTPAPYHSTMAGTHELLSLIRTRSHPTSPQPPELPPALTLRLRAPLPRSPRALLFDIYGTLFASSSGDISLADAHDHASAVRRALTDGPGTPPHPSASLLARHFRAAVAREHERLRRAGAIQPEIDVREVWQRAFKTAGFSFPTNRIEAFALSFELAANPVWPMPGVKELLSRLREAGLPLGIVSNAQFYTPLLFPALLGSTAEELGFLPGLIAYSFACGRAKPDPQLFSGPLAELAGQGIDSSQVAYVGNDMGNDVATAAAVGCMTILFAGDKRSLRLRQADGQLAALMPDSVVQSLEDVHQLAAAPREGM